MQDSIPRVADIAAEPRHILDMYGPDVHTPGTFARNCLLTRRLIEEGVKFVQLVQVGWDHHARIAERHPPDCMAVDQPTAALIADLKQRGLLDDTLVIWGGEFGRTSYAQGTLSDTMGRDHHGGCFTYLLAGGGVKRRHELRRNRRVQLQHRQGPGHRPRPARHDASSARHRSQAAHLSLPGPRLSPDGRVGRGRARGFSRKAAPINHDGVPLFSRPFPRPAPAPADRHTAAGGGARSGLAAGALRVPRACRRRGVAVRLRSPPSVQLRWDTCTPARADSMARRCRRIGSPALRSRRWRGHVAAACESQRAFTTRRGPRSRSPWSRCCSSLATSAAISRTATLISRSTRLLRCVA